MTPYNVCGRCVISFSGYQSVFDRWIMNEWLAHWTQQWVANVYMRFNTLRPRQDGGHFPDDVFKCIFMNENAWISIKISLRFVPKGPINNIAALIQIMTWRPPGDKLLSEPMIVKLPTHICVTRPQWVKSRRFVTGIYLMKQFANNWCLTCCQCTKVCSHVSRIQR